jgi:Uma2 family endonuclease
MRLKPNGSGREPDIFFVAAKNLGRLTDEQLDGPADLVIEVISDESVSRDRDDKYYEYEEGGVREYWIIDPRPHRQRAHFYVLDEYGHYQSIKVGSDGIYHSTAVPGFWLKVDWLWTAELDDVAALAQVVGLKS